jgi:hypothetical protein
MTETSNPNPFQDGPEQPATESAEQVQAKPEPKPEVKPEGKPAANPDPFQD